MMIDELQCDDDDRVVEYSGTGATTTEIRRTKNLRTLHVPKIIVPKSPSIGCKGQQIKFQFE